MNTALAVIDVQKGFINDRSRSVVPRVIEAVRFFQSQNWPVFLTRFVNQKGSGFERWIGWQRLQTSPEIDLCDEVADLQLPVFEKYGYSSFTKDVRDWIAEKSITRLVCCGIATESCVLKTAVDAFEANIEPVVISTACASHGGIDAHEAGLLVLSRFIGQGQLIELADLKFLTKN